MNNIQVGDMVEHSDGIRRDIAIVIHRSTVITVDPMIILSWINEDKYLEKLRYFSLNDMCESNEWKRVSGD